MDRLAFYWFLRRRILPALTHSQRAYRDVLLSSLKARPRWLDLGCGHQFTPDWAWLPDPDVVARLPRVIGVDRDPSSIKRHQSLKGRVLGDIAELPFAPASFDLVTANMVMEHVRHPERVLREVGAYSLQMGHSSSTRRIWGTHWCSLAHSLRSA